MLANLIKTSAVVLLSAQLATAQTSSACNPVEGDKCPDNPAFGGSVSIDFTKGESEYFTVAAGTTLEYDDEKGAVFTIAKETDAPTIASTKYIFFGSVEVVMQASPGQGVVSSIVLQSDDLDEIDWEWLGGDTKQVQTNYFGKGDTSTYDRGGFHAIANPQSTFYTYLIDWSPEAVVWSINGNVVRTLKYAEAAGGKNFPQTPMQLKLGTWDAGASTSPTGTVTWAGGYTPFGGSSGSPYKAYYKSVKIVDRSHGVKGATAYAYGDDSGSYESIVIKTDGESSSPSSSSSSSSKTSTKTAAASGSASSAASSAASAAASGSATATTLTTGTATRTSTSATSTSTASTTSAGNTTSTTAATVSVNGGASMGANLAGVAAALFAAFALL